MARLLSVNVGLPRDIEWQGKTVHTAVWKAPVQGRRLVRRLNIDGDGQGDLAGHGGEHRAVFVYQIESYRYWQRRVRSSVFYHLTESLFASAIIATISLTTARSGRSTCPRQGDNPRKSGSHLTCMGLFLSSGCFGFVASSLFGGVSR